MSGLAPDPTRLFASLGEGVWQRDLNSGEAWYSTNLKVHLHCLVLDGVYRRGTEGAPESSCDTT